METLFYLLLKCRTFTCKCVNMSPAIDIHCRYSSLLNFLIQLGKAKAASSHAASLKGYLKVKACKQQTAGIYINGHFKRTTPTSGLR
jgi:hypothetical protein